MPIVDAVEEMKSVLAMSGLSDDFSAKKEISEQSHIKSFQCDISSMFFVSDTSLHSIGLLRVPAP